MRKKYNHHDFDVLITLHNMPVNLQKDNAG